MAIYQFTVVLIPSQWAENNKNNVASLYEEGGYDASITWKNYQPSKEIGPLLSNILPKGKAWDSELKLWGNEENNDIHVWYEDGKIESIDIRFDLRENISTLLSKVVDLANELNCVLFIPGSESIISANVFNLKKAACESNAAKFVKDPEAFLMNVGSEKTK